MKASLKFREEQRPLWRAKVPISILGLPFISGFAVGEPAELRLDFATAFAAGPTFRVSYRPNDPSNAFSLAVKTGAGAAPVTMSAEFSLSGSGIGGGGPAFRLLFKPRLGDLTLKRSASSRHSLALRRVSNEPEAKDRGGIAGGAAGVGALLAGAEVSATSTVPLLGRAEARLRWGVKIPSELRTAIDRRTAGIALGNLPLLAMSKISIVHVAKSKAEAEAKAEDHVAEAFFSVKRHLEAMRAENGLLRRSLEELRADISEDRRHFVAAVRASPEPVTKNEDKLTEIAGKSAAKDVSEEVKKAGAPPK